MSGRLFLATLLLAPALAAAEPQDAVVLQLVEPGVPPDSLKEISFLTVGELGGRPRLLAPPQTEARLLERANARDLVREAEGLLAAVRERFVESHSTTGSVFDLQEARRLVLRALAREPRLDLLRDAWALEGLVRLDRGEREAAVRAFERVLSSDPGYRPDPRLFPPQARAVMGEVFTSRGEEEPHVLSGDDAAEIGANFMAHHLLLLHYRSVGEGDHVLRAEAYDLGGRQFRRGLDIDFRPGPDEHHRVAILLAEFVRDLIPATAAVGLVAAGRPGDGGPVGPAGPGPAESSGPAWYSRWWVWVLAGTLVAGGAGVAVATRPDGAADLQVRTH